MRLYLVRHGKAVGHWGNDHDRELTPEGVERIRTEAQVMARLRIQPARIYSSPRIRARQTAELIAQALNVSVAIDERVNFGFDVVAIRALIADLPADGEVMFVGHNPGMELTIQALTGADVEMKVGSLARIDLIEYEPALRGRLLWLMAPRVFDSLAGD